MKKKYHDMEPDSTRGEVADPDMDARAHLEGAKPEVSRDSEGDWSLEERTTGENASVEKNRDRDPHIELQEPGASHLATVEQDMFLTLPPSPPTTFEAAGAQRSLAGERYSTRETAPVLLMSFLVDISGC